MDIVRKLKHEIIDGEKCVTLGSRVYNFVEEFRGVREKFWLIQPKSKYLKEPLKLQHILFKFNRNDVSCENWGEVYASRIARQINVPCVEYHLASYTENEKVMNGVICGTFKKNENEVEISVFDVQTMNNRNVKNINTIDEVMKNLMDLIPENEDRKFYFEYLHNALVKQAIFDFILAQTDRHWFNTSFLIFQNESAFNIRKADCYDNGCVAFLKRKQSAIEGITREIKTQGKNSQRLHDLLKNYVPMMGISTPTVELNRDKNALEDKKLKVKRETREKFLDELTDEILYNPEIAFFYHNLKRDINLEDINYILEKEKNPAPQAVSDMIELVMGYQVNVLNELLNEKMHNLKMQESLEV